MSISYELEPAPQPGLEPELRAPAPARNALQLTAYAVSSWPPWLPLDEQSADQRRRAMSISYELGPAPQPGLEPELRAPARNELQLTAYAVSSWPPWLPLDEQSADQRRRAMSISYSVRVFERRGQTQNALGDLTDRVQQLEDAVATLSTEVHHINEAEQFNGRLLQEHKSGSVPPAR